MTIVEYEAVHKVYSTFDGGKNFTRAQAEASYITETIAVKMFELSRDQIVFDINNVKIR